MKPDLSSDTRRSRLCFWVLFKNLQSIIFKWKINKLQKQETTRPLFYLINYRKFVTKLRWEKTFDTDCTYCNIFIEVL